MCLEPSFLKFPNLSNCQIYIDGNNIAYFKFKKYDKPKLSNILLMIEYLIKVLGVNEKNIHCICDPSLKYYIDKPIEYKALIREGRITQAPKVADEFILSFALKHEFCFIISNDKFREYIDQLPSKQWLEERRVNFMIIDDEVCLSPNIEFNKINTLIFESKSKEKVKFNQKTTTLEVLEEIEKTSGEFNLF